MFIRHCYYLSILLVIFISAGCAAKRPSDIEAKNMIIEQLKEAEVFIYYQPVNVEVTNWEKKSGDWIATVEITATAKKTGNFQKLDEFQKLVPGNFEEGNTYFRSSSVVFSSFGKYWVLHPLD